MKNAHEKLNQRHKLSEENQRALQTLLEAYGKTKEFKQRLNDGETLDDILPEAYATVREAKEFKEHPQLAEGLEEKLTSVFLSAQNQGIKISLNRYDINAPSRNAVRVQFKQQSKEKEK